MPFIKLQIAVLITVTHICITLYIRLNKTKHCKLKIQSADTKKKSQNRENPNF